MATPLRAGTKVEHISCPRKSDIYDIFRHNWCNHFPMSSNNIRPSLSVSPLRAHWHVYHRPLHESCVQSSWPRRHRHNSIVSGPYFSCKGYLRPEWIPWLTFSRFSCHYVPTSMYTTDPIMNLMYNFLGLVSIDAPQQYLVLTFLVENISVQEESHG